MKAGYWLVLWMSLLFANGVQAEADPAVAEALHDYFDFADYGAGVIMAEQIPAELYSRFYILDVRNAEQFAQEHIPGAVNIEWRQVFAQRDTLPKDQDILVYCNTSSFAAMVALALRLDGFDNIKIIHGGFDRWRAAGGIHATAQ